MKDKAQLILDVAHSLFLENGYRNTSIQKIADKAGIAKGSVYLHYASKSDIILALLKRFDEEIFAKIAEVSTRSDLEPNKRFRSKLMLVLDYGDEQQRLQSVIQEGAIQMGERLYEYVRESQARWSLIQRDALIEYYGELIKPWLADISIIVNGIVDSFAYYLKVEHYQVDAEKISDSICFTADSYIAALIKDRPEPVFDSDEFFTPSSDQPAVETAETRKNLLISRVDQALAALPAADKDSDQALKESQNPENDLLFIRDTLQRIQKQIQGSEPNLFLLRTLLAGLRPFSEHASLRAALGKYYQIPLD